MRSGASRLSYFQRRLVPPPGRLPVPPERPPRLVPVLRLAAAGRLPGRGADVVAVEAMAGASSDAVAFGWDFRSPRVASSPERGGGGGGGAPARGRVFFYFI
jgi:hypothetical protein